MILKKDRAFVQMNLGSYAVAYCDANELIFNRLLKNFTDLDSFLMNVPVRSRYLRAALVSSDRLE